MLDPAIRSLLKARTHKLKGSAGVIGATRVMQLAGAAEEALEECRPVELAEEILRQLALALTTLREEAELLLQTKPEQTEDTAAKPSESPEICSVDIDELGVLLDSQNLAAIDKFASLSSSLSELIGAVRFDRLRDAIDDLDFQLGAELLHQALSPKRSRTGQSSGNV